MLAFYKLIVAYDSCEIQNRKIGAQLRKTMYLAGFLKNRGQQDTYVARVTEDNCRSLKYK